LSHRTTVQVAFVILDDQGRAKIGDHQTGPFRAEPDLVHRRRRSIGALAAVILLALDARSLALGQSPVAHDAPSWAGWRRTTAGIRLN